MRSTDPITADTLPPTAPVEIPVRYDGPDLDEVGTLTGLGADGVIAAHSGQTWRSRSSGSAPASDIWPARIPACTCPAGRPPHHGPGRRRRAGREFSGIYPRSSPGGWQLIGSTAEPMWDVDRDPPALLQPGAAVTFRAV